MKNPLRTFTDWRRRELERAREKGGLRLFWFYMTMGLAWGLVMVAFTAALDYYNGGALRPGSLQDRWFVYFGGGLVFGLVMWLTQEVPGAGQRRR